MNNGALARFLFVLFLFSVSFNGITQFPFPNYFCDFFHENTVCSSQAYSMLTFDLMIKYIGFCHVHFRPLTSASFDIGIPYLAHGSIPMRECVKYIDDPDTTLNFDLMALCSGLSFFVL